MTHIKNITMAICTVTILLSSPSNASRYDLEVRKETNKSHIHQLDSQQNRVIYNPLLERNAKAASSIRVAVAPQTAYKVIKFLYKQGKKGKRVIELYRKSKIIRKKLKKEFRETYKNAISNLDIAKKGGAVGVAVRFGIKEPKTLKAWGGTSIEARKPGYMKNEMHHLVRSLYLGLPVGKTKADGKLIYKNAGKCAECVMFTKELNYLEDIGWDYEAKAKDIIPSIGPVQRARDSMLVTFAVVEYIFPQKERPKRKRKGKYPVKYENKEACDACKVVEDKLGVIDLYDDSKTEILEKVVRTVFGSAIDELIFQ